MRQAARGRLWSGSPCKVRAPLGPDNRGEPQLPPRALPCSIFSSPGPENPQRHACWRLGPGNSAAPLQLGSLALLAVARLGGHVNSRPVLGGRLRLRVYTRHRRLAGREEGGCLGRGKEKVTSKN